MQRVYVDESGTIGDPAALAASAIFRKCEDNDAVSFDAIGNCFDPGGGVVHGFHVRGTA